LVHDVPDRGAQAVVRGGARCAAQVLDHGAQADARGAAQVLDRGAQAVARGGARRASQGCVNSSRCPCCCPQRLPLCVAGT
jgi:hypothetical protein